MKLIFEEKMSENENAAATEFRKKTSIKYLINSSINTAVFTNRFIQLTTKLLIIDVKYNQNKYAPER